MTNPAAGPQRQDFHFFERLRVRWSEVDMQKIVFNGHYLMYFDTAVASYWRALAMPYHDTMAALGGDLYVRKATLEYEGSARYDDQCDVGLRCARIGTSSMVFVAAVFRGEQRLVHGELVYVFADPVSQTSRPVPATLREVLLGYEQGQAMVSLQQGKWPELRDEIRALRQSVFVDELAWPAVWVEDPSDPAATHVVLRNRLGQVLACARFSASDDGVADIGRLAVHPAVRGSGLGRGLLAGLEEAAAARLVTQLRMQAQASALSFCERLGWVPHGEVFVENGLRHRTLLRSLVTDGVRPQAVVSTNS